MDSEDESEMEVSEGPEEPAVDFDISLPATHAYLSSAGAGGGQPLRGRSVLEAGWRGAVWSAAHPGLVFPGQSVPLMMTDAEDAAIVSTLCENNSPDERVLCLLQPDLSGSKVSGYGVICEVVEVCDNETMTLSLKAKAIHRVKLTSVPSPRHFGNFYRLRKLEVVVLSEQRSGHPLRALCSGAAVTISSALLVPWPHFVYELYDFSRFEAQLREYFRNFGVENLPSDAVELSFFAAANIAVPLRDRLALFTADCALVRMKRALSLVNNWRRWSCVQCSRAVAQAAHAVAMSSEGLTQHYTNTGGYSHEVITVTVAQCVAQSEPSSQFSWFPGYKWTVVGCRECWAHLGWRFTALKRNMRPQTFYGLRRNSLVLTDDFEQMLET